MKFTAEIITFARKLSFRTDCFLLHLECSQKYLLSFYIVERGGALVETMSFNRRVVGSTLALAAT